MRKNDGSLLPPTNCDRCGSLNITFNGKTYKCDDCHAMVGVHPNTNIPLGRMADRETRRLRKQAHCAFDPLWHNTLLTRSEAYEWLAKELQITLEECHFARLSKEQLIKTIEICTDVVKTKALVFIRRKTKSERKAKLRAERENRKDHIGHCIRLGSARRRFGYRKPHR